MNEFETLLKTISEIKFEARDEVRIAERLIEMVSDLAMDGKISEEDAMKFFENRIEIDKYLGENQMESAYKNYLYYMEI